MLRNRSVPAEAILPRVTYDELDRAIEWLSKALGFVEHYRYGQPVSGAQMSLRRAWIMINAARQNPTLTIMAIALRSSQQACRWLAASGNAVI